MTAATIDELLAAFGHEAHPKLASQLGQPEDNIRGPFETLMRGVAQLAGTNVVAIGEASLGEKRVRPDYAIVVPPNPLPVGFVELKAPGVGSDTSRFKPGHNKRQWERLRGLPNVIYTDGQSWTLYRTGIPVRTATLTGDLTVGPDILDDGHLVGVVQDFLAWTPQPPAGIAELVDCVAGLCGLLRAEVLELLPESDTLAALKDDWQDLLFPNATPESFADGYAQAVTFALLLARAEDIDFDGKSVQQIAAALGKPHSLMGKALDVLTDPSLLGELETSVDTLVRVCSVVDWHKFRNRRRGKEPWLHFYENFLAAYDPALRKATGSYYTPTPVVAFMVRIVDELLRTTFDRSLGLADNSVTVVDPAMGTGTFLLETIGSIAETVESQQGWGAVSAWLREAADRIIGFEIQAGPFAVAELRTLATFSDHGAAPPADGLRLYVTDTLDNPYIEEDHLGAIYEAIARSRREANKVKKDTPVLVVLGNPPYGDHAKGKGGWVEAGNPAAGQLPLMDDFREPGNGRHEYVQSNLYAYFWRWALWKAFEAHPEQPHGIVAFITSAGWLNGKGFAGMRRHLRNVADQVWIVDLGGEGRGGRRSENVFAIKTAVAITIVVRDGSRVGQDADISVLPVGGTREQKLAALAGVTLDDGWIRAEGSGGDPIHAPMSASWASYPLIGDLFPWAAPGCKPNRTWVYAPDEETLRHRWDRLVHATPADKPSLFNESRDANLSRVVGPFLGFPPMSVPFRDESGPCPRPVRVSFRTLDRQWTIPDSRLFHGPSPRLWDTRSDQQLYLSFNPLPSSGPATTVAPFLPDMAHFQGNANAGGNVLPLWRDAGATVPNVTSGLLDALSAAVGMPVSAPDLFAYVVCLTSHPGYTERFHDDLGVPGVRVPLTTEGGLFSECIDVGRKIVWLYSYGERFVDAAAGRPPLPPRLAPDVAPRILAPIGDDHETMPDSASYDLAAKTINIGTGIVGPVPERVWSFEVSGFEVVQRWIRRRVSHPEGQRKSLLDDIVATRWTSTTTTELLDLLNVVGSLVESQAEQSRLLDAVEAGECLSVQRLSDTGVFPVSAEMRKPPPAAVSTVVTLFD